MIPNLISIIRMVLLIPILYSLEQNTFYGNWIVLLLLILAAITDGLDGYFARKLNQISRLGEILDPVADKILAGGIVIYLIIARGFPVWYGAIIVSRDVIILIISIFLFSKFKVVPVSNQLGKWTYTIILLSIISFIIDFPIVQKILVPIGAILIILSSISYSINLIRNTKINWVRDDGGGF